MQMYFTSLTIRSSTETFSNFRYDIMTSFFKFNDFHLLLHADSFVVFLLPVCKKVPAEILMENLKLLFGYTAEEGNSY